MKNRKIKLFVISGLSGAGKDSVIKGLKKEIKFTRVITTTTRPKRKREIEGKPYHFILKKVFERMIKNKEFLEWSKVYGCYYGNTRKEVERALRRELPVILVVDYQGAKKIKKEIPQSKVIFLTVESLKSLKERLIKRGQDSPGAIKRRIRKAREELKTKRLWDYVVINKENRLKETIKKVKDIVKF